MSRLISDWYLWLKALHVISVIAWMAGLLYLPRLFVYHCDAPPGSAQSETFKVMERRLLRAIMNPAMIAAYLFGGVLLYFLWSAYKSQGWLHAKLALVVALTVLHHLFALWRKRFERGENTRPARFYKLVNELVTVCMIGVVILVIVKPF
jgi:putative membrane protein